jgi:hypothetical protein
VQAASKRHWKRGQVAQVVERSPEKAGVGGSTPSLATIVFNQLRRITEKPSAQCQPMIPSSMLS